MTTARRILLVVAAAGLVGAAIGLGVLGPEFVRKSNVASRAAETFHQRYDARQFREIYRDATSHFREHCNEAEFLQFAEIHRNRLGSVTKSRQWFRGIVGIPTGTLAYLNFRTDFEKGSAEESFTFSLTGDVGALHSYSIFTRNSPNSPRTPFPSGEFTDVHAAHQEASRRYAFMRQPDSDEYKRFLELQTRLSAKGPDAFKDPEWPLRLAEEAAARSR